MLYHSLILGLVAIPATLAAECFGSPNPGLTLAEYQQVADQVCNVGPNAQMQFGDSGNPNHHRRVVEASYTGTAKIHCREAFANILSQCVQSSGKNGGSWTWVKGAVNERYYIQSFYG